jgi:hypothetical protein
MVQNPSVHLCGGVEVTLKTRIQEVLGSNLGQADSGYPYLDFS